MLLGIQNIRLHREICPRKGHSLPIADGLSRLPIHGGEIPDINVTIHEITGVPESRLEKIIDLTKCDETLQGVTSTVTECRSGTSEMRSLCSMVFF